MQHKGLKIIALFLITAIMAGVNFILINVDKLLDSYTGSDESDDLIIYGMLTLICGIPSFLFIVCIMIENDEQKIYDGEAWEVPVYSNHRR